MASERQDFEGRNLDEAIRAASAGTGIAEAKVQYKILEQGRPGLFGLWARNVKIRVRPPIRVPDLSALIAEPIPMEDEPVRKPRKPAAKPKAKAKAAGDEGRGGRGRREKARQVTPAKADSGDRGGREAGKGEGTGERRERRSRRGRRKREGRRERPARPEATATRAEVALSDPPPEAAEVATTLATMFDLVDCKIEATPTPSESGVMLTLVGDDVGDLTSQDGERLAALQFVLNRMARRTWPSVGRIHLTVDGRGGRRDDELIELTHEVARQVEQTGTMKRLHPMNAYERRLVHLTVRKYAALDSRSEGGGATKRVRIFRPDAD